MLDIARPKCALDEPRDGPGAGLAGRVLHAAHHALPPKGDVGEGVPVRVFFLIGGCGSE